MVELSRTGQRAHCVLVLIDHLLGGRATDVTVVPAPLDEVLGGWRSDPDIVVVVEDVAVAAGRIMVALDRSSAWDVAMWSDALTDMETFLRAQLRPVARRPPTATPAGADARAGTVRCFLASAAGQPFRHLEAVPAAVRTMVDFRCDLGLDPLRWSAAGVEQYLAGPGSLVWSGWGPDLPGPPATVLSAYVAWAGEVAGTPGHLIEDALGVVADLGGLAEPPYAAELLPPLRTMVARA